MTEAIKKHSGKYLRMEGKGGINFQRYIMLGLGIVGLFVFVSSIFMLFVYGETTLISLIVGGALSLLILASFLRTGLELDPENTRFREFEGFLGKTKDAWIDVEDGDYLSIVGFTQTSSGSVRRPSASVTKGMCKVYFWSGDWHLEIFEGNYREALEFTEKFGAHYNLPVNDVNQDQDLPSGSQRSF